jgi:hypothetical protein
VYDCIIYILYYIIAYIQHNGDVCLENIVTVINCNCQVPTTNLDFYTKYPIFFIIFLSLATLILRQGPKNSLQIHRTRQPIFTYLIYRPTTVTDSDITVRISKGYISDLLSHSTLRYMHRILRLTFTGKLSFRVPFLKKCVSCIFRNLARRPAKSSDFINFTDCLEKNNEFRC